MHIYFPVFQIVNNSYRRRPASAIGGSGYQEVKIKSTEIQTKCFYSSKLSRRRTTRLYYTRPLCSWRIPKSGANLPTWGAGSTQTGYWKRRFDDLMLKDCLRYTVFSFYSAAGDNIKIDSKGAALTRGRRNKIIFKMTNQHIIIHYKMPIKSDLHTYIPAW